MTAPESGHPDLQEAAARDTQRAKLEASLDALAFGRHTVEAQAGAKHPFDYQRPTGRQVALIQEHRAACKSLYDGILGLPESRERSLAITKLEEVSFWLNKCIVFRVGDNV